MLVEQPVSPLSSYRSLVDESSSSSDEEIVSNASSEEETTTDNTVSSTTTTAASVSHNAHENSPPPPVNAPPPAATETVQQEKGCFISYYLKRKHQECQQKRAEKEAEKIRLQKEKEHLTHNEQKKKDHKPWIPTSPKQIEDAETAMLSPIAQHVRFRDFVAGLNTISSISSEERGKKSANMKHVVLLHGFGGGAALWAQQWEALATCAPTQGCETKLAVHAIDLPGFARNPRAKRNTGATQQQQQQQQPAAKKESGGKNPEHFFACDTEARNFILQSLDDWFSAMQLFGQRVILVGHSFGGYVASHYLQHSRKDLVANNAAPIIEHLILCDPWGIAGHFRKLPRVVKRILKLVKKTSPLGAIRAVGPFGLKLFRRLRPDFADRWSGFLTDTNTFYEYTYHCNAQEPPIGERAFIACIDDHGNTLAPVNEFLPQMFRDILEQRRKGQQQQKPSPSGCSEDVIETTPAVFSPHADDTTEPHQPHSQVLHTEPLHVTFIYGQKTWMNKQAGYDMAVELEEFVLSNSDGGAVQGVVQYFEIPNAAHQVNSDNAEGFNKAILSAIHTVVNGVELM